MADGTVFRSTLSEKDILIDGLLFMPYKVCVALKLMELIVCVSTSKLDDVGGGVGVGEAFEGFLHWTKQVIKIKTSVGQL